MHCKRHLGWRTQSRLGQKFYYISLYSLKGICIEIKFWLDRFILILYYIDCLDGPTIPFCGYNSVRGKNLQQITLTCDLNLESHK